LLTVGIGNETFAVHRCSLDGWRDS